jgi:hypothetical protein
VPLQKGCLSYKNLRQETGSFEIICRFRNFCLMVAQRGGGGMTPAEKEKGEKTRVPAIRYGFSDSDASGPT